MTGWRNSFRHPGFVLINPLEQSVSGAFTMNHTLKLSLAAGLALLAAWANKQYLDKSIRKERYLVVNTRVLKGQKLTADKLSTVALGGQIHDLKKLCIPGNETNTVDGRDSPRDLEPGELLRRIDFDAPAKMPMRLRDDEMVITIPLNNLNVPLPALRIGQFVYASIVTEIPRTGDEHDYISPPQTQLKQIGPFRLLAIGEHTESDFQASAVNSQAEKQITVAGRLRKKGGGFDEATEALHQAVNGVKGGKVRAIYPHNGQATQSKKAEPRQAAGSTGVPTGPTRSPAAATAAPQPAVPAAVPAVPTPAT